ncbi:hypothetical protein QP179_17275 [Sphingomonas aurantiaca]|uniref:hypothetical protein n=1 Tax=Sphingomonas aurantiaca TaxID=185949 RepID=UPI002FE3BA81
MRLSCRPALILLPLALASCGRSSTDQQDLNSLDAELTNGSARDPALTSALGGQIMVDPRLAQSSNTDAVRPPTQPEGAAVPPRGRSSPIRSTRRRCSARRRRRTTAPNARRRTVR